MNKQIFLIYNTNILNTLSVFLKQGRLGAFNYFLKKHNSLVASIRKGEKRAFVFKAKVLTDGLLYYDSKN